MNRTPDRAAEDRQNLVLSIFGRKGSGKSWLTRELVQDRPRVFYLDSMGEAGERDGFEVVHGYEECVHAMLRVKDLKRFRLSLRTDDTEDLIKLGDLAFEIPDHLIVIEETSFYCSPSYLPPEISKLVRYGRHRGIDQIYIARRPSEIHRDLTAQSDLIVTFAMHEPRDVAYLAAIAPSKEEAEAVRDLPRYKVAAWGDLERAPLAVLSRLHGPKKKPLDGGDEKPLASGATE